jgi:putative membrane protein
MLLVHPIIELVRSFPLLLGALVAGTNSGAGEYWGLVAALIVIALALARWFTTRYRISADRIELRHGLLRRRAVNARLDRVRTVDVTAHLVHRALGLSRVSIGTGTSDRRRPDGLTLDGVPAADAIALRAELLHRAPGSPNTPPEHVLADFDPRWLRYAPFNLLGAATAIAVVGFVARIVNDAHINLTQIGPLKHAGHEVSSASLALVAFIGAILVLVFIALTSTLGYVLAYWGFRLTRHEGGSLHVCRGLITTRNTSVERRRLRGVELSESLPLRWVGGARCLAIATGLRVGRGAERGGTVLLPPAPAATAHRVMDAVLGTAELSRLPLIPHGPAARRRRYFRSALVTAVPVGIVLGLGLSLDWPAATWLVLLLFAPALLLAEDRYRNLGHALVARHLVARSGSLIRRRVAVVEDGVIGWNMRRTFFQRRQGLMTLTAATAAGRQGYRILDVRLAEGESIISSCSPGLLDGIRC